MRSFSRPSFKYVMTLNQNISINRSRTPTSLYLEMLLKISIIFCLIFLKIVFLNDAIKPNLTSNCALFVISNISSMSMFIVYAMTDIFTFCRAYFYMKPVAATSKLSLVRSPTQQPRNVDSSGDAKFTGRPR